MPDRIELLQGTLAMLILRALQWEPQHGYAISQAIKSQSDDVLQVETGSMYPALHRMEKQGEIGSEWKITDTNQLAKFYSLTPAGRKQLVQEHARWKQMVAAIGRIMESGPAKADA